MKFLIITHVPHKKQDNHWFAYAPYVREMNIWLKHVDEVTIVAPMVSGTISDIDLAYQHRDITFTQIPSIEFTSIATIIRSLFKLPIIFLRLYKACQKADHIHLRCPGNIGLLGCLVQIFFPKTPKTAKYAGNWDPNAKQPLSYKVQKWLLSNTSLTKNMQVLVYGHWEHQTRNVKSFFTATYHATEIEKPMERNYSGPLQCIFVGSLVKGKRPLLAIQIIEALHKQGKQVSLDIYGDGVLKEILYRYIADNKLETIVSLHGNQSQDRIKASLKQAHFLILASKSEGWPKAIAEAMFFGAIPIATPISCVPYMLDYGRRGILITPNVDETIVTIHEALKTEDLKTMSKLGSEWSQQFTLDYFEAEIKNILIRS
ncbi:MAG: glycosyl transferase [Flavobacteriales bacterium 32-35-8]|nr:MAG: glycosyl transferase [Flavobacteriales bacterium 32-35-8]